MSAKFVMLANPHNKKPVLAFGALSEAVRTWSELTNTGLLLCGLANITNLADIGRFFLGMGQSTMRDGAC
jgi:hypothetical protein